MRRIIIFILCLLIIGPSFYFSNTYVSDANNYISLESLKAHLGDKEYNQILSYYASVNISREQFNTYVNELNKRLQTRLDEQTYVENLNTYIYFKNNQNKKDLGNLIIKEVDYVNTLSAEQKTVYYNILQEMLNYE